MSAYAKVETQYKDKDCLLKALADVGYKEVEIHDDAQQLIGYHGDLRNDRANIIVRRKFIGSASNDLGFVKTPNGTYSAIISDYDSHRHNAKWLVSLKQSYTEHVTHKEAKRQGLKPYKTLTENGKKKFLYLAA